MIMTDVLPRWAKNNRIYRYFLNKEVKKWAKELNYRKRVKETVDLIIEVLRENNVSPEELKEILRNG